MEVRVECSAGGKLDRCPAWDQVMGPLYGAASLEDKYSGACHRSERESESNREGVVREGRKKVNQFHFVSSVAQGRRAC